MRLNRITLLVTDIDAAIYFFTTVFGLILVNDFKASTSKRIVLLSTSSSDVAFNLAKPKTGDESLVGRQAGQRALVFMDTDNFDADLECFKRHEVLIVDGPRKEKFGRCILVKDLVGNTWEFVERA